MGNLVEVASNPSRLSLPHYNFGEPFHSLQTVNSHKEETLAKFNTIARFCWQSVRIVQSLWALGDSSEADCLVLGAKLGPVLE